MSSIKTETVAGPGLSKVAKKIEQMEIHHIKHQAAACTKLFQEAQPKSIEHAEYFAAVTRPEFGWKLNRVVGFGLGPSVTENDISAIENAYKRIGLNPEFDIPDFAEKSAYELLKSKGYREGPSWGEIFVRSLDDVKPISSQAQQPVDDALIHPVDEKDYGKFIEASVAGYKDTGRPVELLKALAEIALLREDTHQFALSIDGHFAGTAAMAIGDVEDTRIGLMYLDSVVPGYRGKAIHSKLLAHRIRVAKGLGCHYVTMGVKPGRASAKNARKNGYEMTYHRFTYVKSSEDYE